MSKPSYDRRKVRRAMLVAPVIALLGIVPFVFQLDLTFLQFLLAAVAALVVSYVMALLFGTPGYLILRHLGYAETKYLMAYAALLVIATPFVLDDIYALLTFGPPTLLAAGAFCFVRGSAIDAAENSNNIDVQTILRSKKSATRYGSCTCGRSTRNSSFRFSA